MMRIAAERLGDDPVELEFDLERNLAAQPAVQTRKICVSTATFPGRSDVEANGRLTPDPQLLHSRVFGTSPPKSRSGASDNAITFLA